jgi:predicted aspartyl protease
VRAAVLLSVALVACGGGGGAPRARAPHAQLAASQAAAAERTGPPSRKAKLHYELNGRPFPLPVIHGTVSGQPTWMLVDTGANSHVIAGWFAKKAGLTLAKLGDIGTDHAGRTIATSRAEHPHVKLEGWGELADGPMLVTDVPPIIEKLGIGAFISPQRLTEDGDAVILDLAAAEIRATMFDEALKAERFTGPTLIGEDARVCEDTQSPIKGLAFVVPTSVDGQKAELLVDTGAQRSDLLAASDAGQALASRSIANKEQMYGASGRLTSRTVKGARLRAGELAFALDVDLIGGESDPYCPRDGVLSMDVLRSCVLVLGRKQIAARCATHR